MFNNLGYKVDPLGITDRVQTLLVCEDGGP